MIECLHGVHEIVDYHSDFRVRVFVNDEDESYPRHWHSDIEMIMPLEGGYKVAIDDKVYHLNKEDILVIPPGELHELFAPKEGERLIIQFDGTLLHSLKGFQSAFHIYHPCVEITKDNMPEIHGKLSGLLKEISEEYLSTMPFREAAAYSGLIRFFTLLGRNYIKSNDKLATVKRQKRHQYIEQMFQICSYIEDHCMEDLDVDQLAEMAGFSRYHFARLFKQVMNISCYDYLIKKRVSHAEKLLMNPEETIMDIAMQSGFSSLATFNRVFKAKNHCTPTEYKSLIK